MPIQIKTMEMSKIFNSILTLLAHLSPHALQRDLGPAGPRRIIGVDFELILQCLHLLRNGKRNFSERCQLYLK